MPIHDNHNNDVLNENWHLLAAMRARKTEINSTVIREYFIVVWLIFCFLLLIVISDVSDVLLVLHSLSYWERR
jgi:hypothetical protein